MKKYLSFLLVAAFALSTIGANAQENTPEPATTAEPRQIRTEARDAFRLQMEQNRETFRQTLSKEREAFKNRTKEEKEKFWNGTKRMIGERFTAAVTNTERMQARVGEIITKLEAQGKNTDGAEKALDLSKSKLSDAKKKIEEIQKLIPASGTAITPEIFEQIKLKAREAKDLLKESHAELKNAIVALKELRENNSSQEAQ